MIKEEQLQLEIQQTQNRLDNSKSNYSGVSNEYTLGLELLLELKKVRLELIIHLIQNSDHDF